ncbi:MAG: histidinol-phosphate transaminase [Cyclobacteriaceae bacterium]|nr:histidinol-phosphate transaminase [Cyclobacteriaceae bacterium]
MNINAFIRENIKKLKPYSTARDEFQGIAEVYLDANENPFPSAYNRYPDPLQKKLKQRISELKGIAPEKIFLGNGSDEPVDLVIRAFCEPGQDSILITEPTYGMYAVCAGINNVAVKRVPLTHDFNINIDAIKQAVNQSVKVIFLCSPNNPSGNLLSKEKITQLITDFNGIVVIDEAYIDFADDEGFLPTLNNYSNLIILQTFSKAWGLAGLRLGMAFASEAIISVLNKIKYPYNINILTQQAALEKLSTVEIKNKQVGAILQQRTNLIQLLQAMPNVQKVYPTDANFVLVKIADAKNTYNQLIKRGIIVRDRSAIELCENCLRITVGTPEENKKLIETLNTL